MNYMIVDTELYHARTKGSKNGIRLYQYKDGTYTEEGKARRRKSNPIYMKEQKDGSWAMGRKKKTAKQINEQKNAVGGVFRDATSTTSGVKKLVERMPEEHQDLSHMTNRELQRYITRANLERQYNQITAQEVRTGKQKRLEMLDIAGDVLSVAGSATALALSIIALKRGG